MARRRSSLSTEFGWLCALEKSAKGIFCFGFPFIAFCFVCPAQKYWREASVRAAYAARICGLDHALRRHLSPRFLPGFAEPRLLITNAIPAFRSAVAADEICRNLNL